MEEEKRIVLPEPEGTKRAAMRFRNGGTQVVDLSVDELVATLTAFAKDPEGRPYLELPDGQYAMPLHLTRAGLDDIQLIFTTWVKITRRSNIAVPDNDGPVVELRRTK